MRYLNQRIRQRTTAQRALVAVALLAFATACHRDDPLPTGPPPAAPSAPLAAVLGADVTGLGFEAAAINEAGQVAGTLNGRAVLRTAGGPTQDLGTLGGPSSRAYAINSWGHVAGASTTATGDTHAFLWTPNDGMRDLGTLGVARASIAYGMNDRGEVVGENIFPPVEPYFRPVHRAFRWTLNTGMEDLGSLSQGIDAASIAFDINNAGHVVGRSYSAGRDILPPTDPEYFSRAFLWTPGQGMQDIGALSGGYSIAYAINDIGQVVGRSWVSRPTSISYHAFRWRAGEGMIDLGAFGLAGDSSSALGINDAGQVVGWSTAGLSWYYGIQAFIWTPSEGLESLTPTTGIGRARGINSHQQVVGDSRVATVHLGPGNVPPVARSGGPYTGTEGSEVQLDMSGTDLDGAVLYGHVYYGDGDDEIFYLVPFVYPTYAGRHLYADNGTYTLELIVSDVRGGYDTATTTVTIANVAPTILSGSLTGPTAPIQLMGGSASAPISFDFKDMGGKRDVYAAEVACGNGVVLTATDIPVVETYQNSTYTGGRGTYSGACTYTSAGVYTVRATVSDEDGGASGPAFFPYVIVYDPAGSTTGTGFYDVPGQGNRKAHFAFDVSFPGGGAVPNGAVRLWVPGGEMNFESSGVEMLVASANRAQFWGTGTLNGAPARFRITAIDGQERGHGADAIRVELWDASGATVLYDTQPGAAPDAPVTTPTGGGNIRIRAG